MNTSPSKGELRRQQLLQLLKQHTQLGIQEMKEQLGCSEATIRRDLELLEETGEVIRTSGGARYDIPLPGMSFLEKKQLFWPEKEAIARRAANLVQPGDVVGMTGGTTTFLIAKAIKSMQQITVVTNAVNIAMELSESPGIQIVLTGGVMHKETFELIGPLAEKILDSLFINKTFVGIDGMHAEAGLTTHSELEARIAQMMMQRSEQSIAVFDSSKAGKCSLFPINPLSSLHAAVTDRKLPEPLAKMLKNQHISIHYAE